MELAAPDDFTTTEHAEYTDKLIIATNSTNKHEQGY
jgi:hypothetical protein